MDEVIFEEFKGTGNLEIVLDRNLVDRRIYPAIDINMSGTRREEMLMDPDEHKLVCQMRRVLSEMNAPDAMELLKSRLEKTKSNAEFLMSMDLT
jgi:transcription termination factor Rho